MLGYIWWTSVAQPQEELYIAQQSAHSSSENEAAEETHDTDVEPGSAIGSHSRDTIVDHGLKARASHVVWSFHFWDTYPSQFIRTIRIS